MVERVRSKKKKPTGRPPKEDKNQLPAVNPGSTRWTATMVRQWAYETGELPHMILLRLARGETVNGVKPTKEEQIDCAKAAAPYFAPKLQSVQLTDRDEHVPPTQLIVNEDALEGLDDDERTVFAKVFNKLIGRTDPREAKDTGDKAKTENRFTRTLDLKAEK